MTDNFQCADCGNTFFVASYSVIIIGGKSIYKTKGHIMNCGRCGLSKLKYIEPEGDYSTVQLGRFQSMNDDQKKQVLHQRTKKYNSRPSEVEYKRHVESGLTKKIKGI